MNLKDIFGFDIARCSQISVMYPASVIGVLRNLRLTGVLKKTFLTMTVVPLGMPISEKSISLAPSIAYLTPTSSSFVFVIISTCATAAILDKASPRKPNVRTLSISSASVILLVACL